MAPKRLRPPRVPSGRVAPQAEPLARKHSGIVPRPPLVLVVDDLEDTRLMITTYLSHSGFRVTEAESGTDALEATARERPALVVLDVDMPDITGLEVCRRLKQSPETADIAVVVLTASGPATEAAALAAGASAFLEKPCALAALVRVIMSTLAHAAQQRAAREAQA